MNTEPATNSEPMVRIEHVSKAFGDLRAVDDVSFDVYRGEVFGFIGPNGAGKTTTIKMLATLLLPTSGRLLVGGHDVEAEPYEVRRLIGYMPDSFGVYEDLLVWEYLDYFAALYKLPVGTRRTVTSEVLELTDLTSKRDAQVMSLSRGMKQRLCLAKTLLHGPEVLLLDEPASGLDPHARIEIRELIRELCRMGKTVIVSSHILSELADFCTSIAIIETGKLLASGGIDEISARLAGHIILAITVKGEPRRALDVLAARPDIPRTTSDGRTIRAEFSGDSDDVDEVLESLVKEGVRVLGFSRETANLEDIFLRVTRGVVS